MGLLSQHALLPQHRLSLEVQAVVYDEITAWLTIQSVDFLDARRLSFELFNLAYARRLKLNSDEPIVEHLIQLAKEIALELDERDELLTLLDK